MISVLLLTACGTGDRAPVGEWQARIAGVEVPAVEHPDLAGVEEAARRQIEGGRGRLEEALAGDPARAEAAAALGEMGRLYHAYGLSRPAAACYRGAVALARGEPRWPYLLGVLHQGAGEMAAAAAAFEEALARRPADGAALLRLGEAQLALNRPEEARRRFGEARSAGEDFGPAARFGLGRAAAAADEASAAVEHFEAALAARPDAGRVRYPLALALRSLGREEEARQQLALPAGGEVAFPDPEADALAGLAAGAGARMREGGVALTAGRLEEAQEAYREAVAADPESTEARRNLALALERQGRHAEAARELEAALARSPDDVWLRFDLGTALLGRGDLEGAAREFRRAVERAPEFTSARFNLANTLIRLGRWQEAAGHLEEIVAAEPGHANALYLLAMEPLQRGDAAAAERRLRALLADHPGHAPARQGLAQALARQGDLDGARRLYQEALELDLPPAEEAAAQRALGQLLLGERRFAEAAGRFARAVELAPEDAGSRLAEAVALSGAGRDDEARERLERGRESLPADPGLPHALARLLATSPDPAVRDGARALDLARAAYQARPSLEHAETVAMALAAAGDPAAAARWLRALLAQLAGSGAPPAAADRLRRDLARYERGEALERPLG